jgi:hypothetical protein
MHTIRSRLLQLTAHTIWWDNFSKVRPLQIPDLDVGSWQNCNWSGIAFRKARKEVDMDLMIDPQTGGIIPAMPNNPFIYVENLKTIFKNVNQASHEAMFLFDSSKVQNWAVNVVPLKPDPDNMEDGPWRDAVVECNGKLDNLFTDRILDINIGSNEGLLTIMRSHYVAKGQDQVDVCQQYSAINVDIDIHNRILKVCVVDKTLFIHTHVQSV